MGDAMNLLMMIAILLLPTVSSSAAPDKEVRMQGSYQWEAGGSKDSPLRATFTSTGEPDQWTVAFYFRFQGKSHTYRGTANGSLDNGELAGTVQNENRGRTWSFRGTSRDGTFTGTHSEKFGGSWSETGTLELKK